jgi:hypothetical protein
MSVNIVCDGPGPHIPANGVLGTADRPVQGMRCSSPACVPTPPQRQLNRDLVVQRLGAFLALPAPTATQTRKAIKGLVALVLDALDDVTDT